MEDKNSYIGKQVGSYHIVAKLDSGSYGSVYKGEHIIFKENAAIKILHAYLHSSEERNRFVQEAQLLKKLTHPNILHILDAGFQDGIPYIVTEYASNGSLNDFLKQHPRQPLPLENAIIILTQIGQALQYAHQQKIVHRDLKPANILFNAKGDALLADFGIAVILESAHTRRFGRGGTPAYMAPEQFNGLVSNKSDQYALGCIAYELITGYKPFDIKNPSLEAIWYHHAQVEPTAPTKFNSAIPTYIEQAILTAMRKDRNQRHNDVSVFITALHKTKKQWLQEGFVFSDSEQYEEALFAFEQAIDLDPDDASAYISKGFALNELGRYDEALFVLEQAIDLDPDDAGAYRNKGVALNELGRYDEALFVLEQAIDLDPDYASAYRNKGIALNELERYEEALFALEQAIDLDPDYASAYRNKGFSLNELERYEEALFALEQAIDLDPDDVSAYCNKGFSLNNLGRYEEALFALEQAIALDPNNAIAYNNKGIALNNLGRYEEALFVLEQAIDLDPDYTNAYRNKGVALVHLRRNTEARRAYKKSTFRSLIDRFRENW